MSQSPITDKIPKSATHSSTGIVGLIAFLTTTWQLQSLNISPTMEALIIIAVGAAAMILWEVFVLNTHKRESTGINWNKIDLNPNRAAIKYLGLVVTIATLSFLYFLFPEYSKASYRPAWDAALLLLPFLIPAAFFYILLVDMVMKKPEDGYYQIGLIALGKHRLADKTKIAPHIRSWMIKGFFIPLMFMGLVDSTGRISFNAERWQDGMTAWDMMSICLAITFFIFLIDLFYTVTGYIFSSRLIDTHERSSEPTILGWLVTIICYQPFWDAIDHNFLHKGPSPNWEHIATSYPIFAILWASIYVLAVFIYTWSTMAFGLRFSNLTHRGIITSGPYRFTKHPAYISKNISWWLTAAPFLLMLDNPVLSMKTCVVLLMINAIYYMRAKTEERHLSLDPTYRDYAAWMDRHGLFRWWPLKGTWPVK